MPAMIPVTRRIALAEDELGFTYTRSTGPGGQHVNTTATAVELRFDAARSPSLPEEVRARLLARADRRLTAEGVFVIVAQEHRSQARNREEAAGRLLAILREAAVPPKVRRPTRPTLASKQRRLSAKSSRAAVKGLRRGPARED